MAARTTPTRTRTRAKVAVPDPAPPSRPVRASALPPTGPEALPSTPPMHEPVWLVRFVLVLFLIGFAAFLAREVANFRDVLP